MNNKLNSYYSYRLRLEELKLKSLTLIVIARLLFLLAVLFLR